MKTSEIYARAMRVMAREFSYDPDQVPEEFAEAMKKLGEDYKHQKALEKQEEVKYDDCCEQG